MSFEWQVIWQHAGLLLQGLGVTVVIVVLATAIGAVIGAVFCLGYLLGRGPLLHLARIYVGVVRSLPEIIVMFWVYYCGPLVLDVRLSAFQSGLLSLSLISGAWLTEIFRAGVQAVPRGQFEAAKSLGLNPLWIAFDVIIPQAARIMMPPFIGFLTLVLKQSALVYAIGVGDLFYQANLVGANTYRYLEMFTAIGVIYFLLILPLSMLAEASERRRLQAIG